MSHEMFVSRKPFMRLDHEFSPSRFSHRMSADDIISNHIRIGNEESKKARDEVDFTEIVLGNTKEQRIHVFSHSELSKDCPIFVFIHGGYWQMVSLEKSSFMVPSFIKANIMVTSIGYDLCPTVSMEELVQQVQRAVAKVLQLASERGSRGVYVCGHSAGGHLAAMMLAVDWTKYEADSSLLKGVIPVSGVFDLRPLVESYVNDPLHMTFDSAWELSPMKHSAVICERSRGKAVTIAYGQHDPPQFRLQSQLFAKELEQNNVSVKCIEIENTDHFDVIERLKDSDFILTKEIIAMIRGS